MINAFYCLISQQVNSIPEEVTIQIGRAALE